MSNATSKVELKTNHQTKNFGSSLRVIAVTILIFIFTQVLAVGVAMTLAGVFTDEPLSSALDNSIAIQFAYIVIAEATIIGSVYLVLKRRQLSFSHIGFGRRPKWHDLMMALITYVLFIISLVVVTAIIKGLWHGYDTNQLCFISAAAADWRGNPDARLFI